MSQREMSIEQELADLKYGMTRFGAFGNAMPVLSKEVDQFTDRRGEYDLCFMNQLPVP